jgi:hypothetical protein
MRNKRTIVTISEDDKLWLVGYSKAQKISVAKAIRRGIKCLKESTREKTYHRLVENTKGIWKKGDGLKYQEKLRSEWHQ